MRKFLIVLVMCSAAVAVHGFAKKVTPSRPIPAFKKIELTLGAGMRGIKEKLAEKVYKNNNLAFSFDLAVHLGYWSEIFMHTDIMSLKGKSTYTGDEAKLTLLPMELGIRFLTGRGMFRPYAGLGGGYYRVKENAGPIGSVQKSSVGFICEGGLRCYLLRSVFADLRLKYTVLKLTTYEKKDLGGLFLGGGLGFAF